MGIALAFVHATAVSTVLVMLTVMVGAAAQRITGMGFAILSAPFLVLIVGGFEGVLMVNVCAASTSAVILARVWRDVEWPRWRLLIAGATIGVAPGAWVIAVAPTAWLELAVGVLVIVGLIAARLAQARDLSGGRWTMVATGAISGLMNTSAGIGGPALSVYAVATSWEQRSLVATVQPYFLGVGALTLVALHVAHAPAVALDPWLWASLLIACAAGLLIGEWLSSRVSSTASYRMLLALAVFGALAAATRGGLSIAGVSA